MSDAPPKTYDDLFPSLPSSAQPQPGSGKAPIGTWNRKPMFAPTTVTQVFHIPSEERRGGSSSNGSFGTDDSNRILKSVMEKTGAKVELSSNKDQSLTFLITGKQEAVLRARRELLVQFQTQASSTISIPKEHHKFILGKGGSNLQKLEARTATKINIPKATDSSDKITISGPKEGIEKALHDLRITSEEQSKQASENVIIPKQYHPFISGPSGETSRKLIGDLQNVRIHIPPLSSNKEGDRDRITVAGEKEAVNIVVGKIKQLHKEIEKRFSEVSVEVKKSQHKYIIGPKGNSINEILAETGVFVEMPNLDSTSETITLRGDQAKLGLALTKVYEKANSVVSYDVSCPNWLHKYIIGKKGASIQKLTTEYPRVHIELVESCDKIKVEGPPEEVDKAKEALEIQARDLVKNMATVEINVDAKYHKHIIGKGGSTVNKIKQETDVMINIPVLALGMTTIKIEGNKEGVKKARAELESMVKKMENEREKDLIIESRFHRQLIGPKGETIQKMRDEFENVQISFPDLGSKSDIVKLRGPKADVEKCTKQLNNILKELKESSYQVKVPVFKQFHKFVIGKGGATIRKIRAETDTRIDLPESGSQSDVILITGKKANVEEAEKRLNAIQSEMADLVTEEVIISSKIHNTMIGSGGRLVQSVMDDCGGVSIKFPAQDSKSDKVTIRGPKDDVEKAKKMLLEMANLKTLSSITAEVRAKPEHHKFLIGRNGANVQSIRNKTGARIVFPAGGDQETDKDREVIVILGTKEAVEAAKIELENRIKGLDNIVEDTMTVDPKHHKFFVARRGEVLRHIGDEFGGVIVSFPRSGVASDKVTLKGAKNCVEGAKSRILEIVNDLDNQVTIECIIDQQHHRTVMGARGSKVQAVCMAHNVQIKIPEKSKNPHEQNEGDEANNNNNNSNVIRISGLKENCEKAEKALQALVPINIEVEVPYEFHRFIIGAKGSGVRALMDTHDVNIKVPASEQQSNIIVVTGTEGNVEEAKQALLAKVEELEQEKADKAARNFEVRVEVSSEFHPKIIGRKGAVIQELRQKYDVNVQLNKRGAEDENTITITGLEENAILAKEAILKIVNDIESMTKEEVRIDPRIHAKIIGKRGFGIRKIMQDFNVDIKLPRNTDAEPDLVVIMGSEDAVLDCKDHLLNLEEEFLQDVMDKEWMDEYTKPKSRGEGDERKVKNNDGFKVGKGAPWQGASDEAFPTLGGLGGGPQTAPASSAPVWGPRR